MRGVQPPGLALGGPVQPTPPRLVAIGLVAEELDPGEGGRVLDVFRAGVDRPGKDLDELVIELQIELGLVTEEPYWGLISLRFRRGPGGSVLGNGPQTDPVVADRLVRFNVENPICRGFLRVSD